MNIKIEDVALTGSRSARGRGGSIWAKTFNTMKVGQSFFLSAGNDEELKQVRNCKAAANSYNKANNNVKIDWRAEGEGFRFGPIPGPGAESAATGTTDPGQAIE
jgi:hypothetical protein